jgi:hypothetical protein
LGPGHEGSTLKASRAYVAGLGTTGVLIGSFFLLLTVGSTLVAFRGVPGAASNGDLSSIELRQQREAEAQRNAGLLSASNLLGDAVRSSRGAGASGDVFGQLASGGRSDPAGVIRQDTGVRSGPGALSPGTPGAPLGEKAPSTDSPASPGSGTGVIAVPVDPGALADGGPGSSDQATSGSDSATTDTGSSDTGSASSGSGSGSTGGSGSSDTGSGTSGSDSGSGSTGGTTGTVGGTVGDTTGSVGSTVGTVTEGGGQAVSDTGSAGGGLLNDATSVVEGLGVTE